MYLKTVEIRDFRNIESAVLQFSDDVNIILGKNAQGKTNLLEAIWLLSGNKSFRGAQDREFCSFGKQNFFVGGRFENEGDEFKLTLGCDTSGAKPQKKVVRGEKAYSSARALLGAAPMSVFSPDDLELVKAGPSGRRNYCDALLSTLFPSYAKTLSRYNRIVSQKNALLKSGAAQSELEIWNEQLTLFGASVIKSRCELIKRLLPYAQSNFSEMTQQKEELDVKYSCTICEDTELSEAEIKELFLKKISENAFKEQAAESCLYGPHRDDIEFFINGNNARQFASQGQQRSVVLALLLSKTSLIKNHTGKTPIVLLDDVMSELDSSRQSYLLNKIKDFQVFITCCQDEIFEKSKNKATFIVENGKFTKKEE